MAAYHNDDQRWRTGALAFVRNTDGMPRNPKAVQFVGHYRGPGAAEVPRAIVCGKSDRGGTVAKLVPTFLLTRVIQTGDLAVVPVSKACRIAVRDLKSRVQSDGEY